MAIALPASATSIAITNFSFEDPGLGDGVWNSSITGWTISGGTAGVWNPQVNQTIGDGGPLTDPTQAFIGGIPDGAQVAYSNGGDIEQTTGVVLEEGYRYTLKVWVGGRSAIYSNKPYAVILAGTNPLITESGFNAANSWAEVTASYTATPPDPNVGQTLKIKLVNGDGVQLDFDKVTLDKHYVLTCEGFLPPFDKPLTLKGNDKRAIPVKMVLHDLSGDEITDLDISSPPVVNVYLAGVTPPSVGYNSELVPPGLSDDGNTFRYDPSGGFWLINLATKQFTAAGTYTVTVALGGDSYTFVPNCSQTFTRLP